MLRPTNLTETSQTDEVTSNTYNGHLKFHITLYRPLLKISKLLKSTTYTGLKMCLVCKLTKTRMGGWWSWQWRHPVVVLGSGVPAGAGGGDCPLVGSVDGDVDELPHVRHLRRKKITPCLHLNEPEICLCKKLKFFSHVGLVSQDEIVIHGAWKILDDENNDSLLLYNDVAVSRPCHGSSVFSLVLITSLKSYT